MALANKIYDVDDVEPKKINELRLKSISDVMEALTDRKRSRNFITSGVDLGKTPLGSFILGKDDNIVDPEYLFWKDHGAVLPNTIKGVYGNVDPMSRMLMARQLSEDQRRGIGSIVPGMEMKNINPEVLQQMGADVWSPGYSPKDANLFFVTGDKSAGLKGNVFTMDCGHRSGINDNVFPRNIYDKNALKELTVTPSQFNIRADSGVILNSFDNIPKITKKSDKVYHFSADHKAMTGGAIRPQLIRGANDRLQLQLGPERWHRFGKHFIDDMTMMKANFVPYKDGVIHRTEVIPLKQSVRNNALSVAKNYLDDNRENMTKVMVGSGLMDTLSSDVIRQGGKKLAKMATGKLVSELPTMTDIVTNKGKNLNFDTALSTGTKLISEGKKVYKGVKGIGSKIKGLFSRKKNNAPTTTPTAVTTPATTSVKLGKRANVESVQKQQAVSAPGSKRRRKGAGVSNNLLQHLQNLNYN